VSGPATGPFCSFRSGLDTLGPDGRARKRRRERRAWCADCWGGSDPVRTAIILFDVHAIRDA
jgi:hypothetical protein